MARFYASDVTYILYTTPLTSRRSCTAPGDHNNEPSRRAGLPNLQWLTPNYISGQLGTSSSSSGGGGSSSVKNEPAGWVRSFWLNSVSVSGTHALLQRQQRPGPAHQPTFALNITNGVASTRRRNVVCKVTVGGTSGQKVVPEITAGQLGQLLGDADELAARPARRR